MDPSTTHDFSTADFSFLPQNEADQFIQFPPNSPGSHPFSFGETQMPSYPSYGFGPSVPAAVPAHGVMDTTSTPSPRQPFVPASPMTPPLTGSEISGDSLSQGHGWTPTNTTPGGRSGYNSGYNSASGYVSGGAGSRSGTGSPGSSHSFQGYGSGLVHRSNRGITRGMADRSSHKRRGSTSMRMADEDSYGSDPESELGLNLPADVVVSRRREEIRRQRIESEQRRRDDLREGFARLKDVLPVSNQKGSKMALLDRVYPLWPINLVACDPGPRLRSRQPPPITQTKLADPLLFTATSHIRYLEAMQQQMQTKLTASEMEVNRLRQINEALMLKAAERRSSQSPL
ncbi:helix loop helix domain, partial [Rhizoctonia solani]